MDQTIGRFNYLRDQITHLQASEQRRFDVHFDTEKQLIDKKQEVESLKKELKFMTIAKNDIERAYQAQAEEKRLLERELLTLRG